MNGKTLFLWIIFLLLAIGITTGLILENNSNQKHFEQNNTNSGETNATKEDEEKNIEKEQEVKRLKIALNNTYNENSITFQTVNYKNGIIKIMYNQITGLKNKEVEQKINTKLKESALSMANEKEKTGLYKEISVYQHILANYGNAISFANNETLTLNEKNKNGDYDVKGINLYYNINLIDGTPIKFEDLFIDETEILNIVNSAIYEQLVFESSHDSIEKLQEQRNGLITEIDEYKLQRLVNAFKKVKNNIKYCFTDNEIIIDLEDENYRININMSVFVSNIAIYKRFLTDESIYENDDIGEKEKFVFEPNYYSNIEYNLRGVQAENLYVDFKIFNWVDNFNRINWPDNSKEIIKNEIINELNQELENYKQLATENKNEKYFALYIVDLLANPDEPIKMSGAKYEFSMPVEYYDEIFSFKLADAYRAERLSIPYFQLSIVLDDTEPVKKTINQETRFFKIQTGEEIVEF